MYGSCNRQNGLFVKEYDNNTRLFSFVFEILNYDGGTQHTYKRGTVFSSSFPLQKISAKPLQADLSISFDQQHIYSVTNKEALEFHTKKDVAIPRKCCAQDRRKKFSKHLINFMSDKSYIWAGDYHWGPLVHQQKYRTSGFKIQVTKVE